jgi:putative ABC transport system permease protein
VLGFLAYAWLSFERRVVELGVLRVLGLSARQLLRVLFYEQAGLIALGILLGTGLGLAASLLFVPFLQVEAAGQTPRFIVETAWADIGRVYAALGLALLGGQVATAWMVRRLRLAEAVKLGEE